MKNEEFVIELITKTHKIQAFRKINGYWWQLSSLGRLRKCTAEQVLNHLLPALFLKDKQLTVNIRTRW
jgi:hypothetical protein